MSNPKHSPHLSRYAHCRCGDPYCRGLTEPPLDHGELLQRMRESGTFARGCAQAQAPAKRQRRAQTPPRWIESASAAA